MKIPRFQLVLPIAAALGASLALGFSGGESARGYVAFAKKDFKEALRLYESIGDRSGAGMVFLAQNRPDEARKRFEEAGDESGLGLCALKKREYNEAIRRFLAKGDQRGLGLAHLGLRDEAKAREAFSKANDWSGLGLLHLAKNQYKKADDCFRRVKDESGLGLTAVKERRFEDAERHFTTAKDDSGLGLARLARRDYERAAAYFTKANDKSGLGYVALARGDYAAAESLFTETNDQNGLGDLYSQVHNFPKARAAFEADHNAVKVIQSHRNDYTLPDRLEKAAAYGEAAVAEGRMAPECLMELGDIYYEMKKPDKGLEILDKAASYPGYASESNLRKGRIYFYLRRFDEAERAFRSVQPDDFIGRERYEDAQTALKTIELYKTQLKDNSKLLQPAENF